MKKQYLLLISIIILLSCGSTSQQDTSIESPDETIETSIENASFRYREYCVGCQNVVLLDGKIFSELIDYTKMIEMSIIPTNTDGILVNRRMETLAKKIPIESCKILNDNVHTVPKADILDAGDVTFQGDWSSIELANFTYSTSTNNYSTELIYQKEGHEPKERIENYGGSRKVTLKGNGSQNVKAFEITATTMAPIVLTYPKVNSNGEVPQVDTQAPLNITWRGGESENIHIFLRGDWISSSDTSDILACNVQNDGNFTIDTEILKSFNWANLTTLMISDSKMVNMSLSHNQNSQLTISSASSLYIHQDINATPIFQAKTMDIGYVGTQCSSDDDCGGGECLKDTAFAEGYCSIKNCTSDNMCPSDAHCFIQTTQFTLPQFCAMPCENDTDCRGGGLYHCREADNGTKSCVPAVK